MGMFPVGVVPARDEGDSRMLRLAAEHLVVFHLQAEPGAAVAPGADAVEIEAGLLRRQRGVAQVVHQSEGIGAVARAHQGFRGGRGMSLVIAAAAIVERVAAAAGTGGLGHGYHQYLPKFSGLAQNWDVGGCGPSVAGFIGDLKRFW